MCAPLKLSDLRPAPTQSDAQGSGAAVQSLTYAYNPEGYVDTVTDALMRTTRYGY